MTSLSAPAKLAIPLWTLRRETALNWLALGVLLAAWNASYNDVPDSVAPRPKALRGSPYVSVRAINKLSNDSKGHISVNVL